MLYCYFGAWLPVCLVQNSAELLRCAPEGSRLLELGQCRYAVQRTCWTLTQTFKVKVKPISSPCPTRGACPTVWESLLWGEMVQPICIVSWADGGTGGSDEEGWCQREVELLEDCIRGEWLWRALTVYQSLWPGQSWHQTQSEALGELEGWIPVTFSHHNVKLYGIVGNSSSHLSTSQQSSSQLLPWSCRLGNFLNVLENRDGY